MNAFLKYFIEAVKQTYRSIIVYSIFKGLLIEWYDFCCFLNHRMICTPYTRIIE